MHCQCGMTITKTKYKLTKPLIFSIIPNYSDPYMNLMKINSFLDSYDINAIPQESKNRQYKDYKPILDFLNNVCESRIYENQSSITMQGISVESTRNNIDNIKDHFELEAFQFRAYCPYNACIVEHSQIPYHYPTSCSIVNFPILGPY